MCGNGLFKRQAECRTQHFVLKCEGDIGRQKTNFVATVIGHAIIFQAMERLGRHQSDHGVGDLNFAATARALLFNFSKDLWLENVAPRNDKV
jgi:hypothetical protein